MDIFTESLLADKVSLSPIQLNGDIRANIERLLRERYEAKCSRFGYIRRNSINVHKIGAGQVQMVSLNGDVCYPVEFFADVCLPSVGMVVKAVVKNMNRFGVLCEVSRDKDIVLEIIVAKNASEIVSEVNLDELKPGMSINVEILGRKYELNDKKISIIGKIVVNTKASRVVQRSNALAASQSNQLDDDQNMDTDDGDDVDDATSSETDEELSDADSEMAESSEERDGDEEEVEEDEENNDEDEDVEESEGSESDDNEDGVISDSEEF